jgi:hypothetical protein
VGRAVFHLQPWTPARGRKDWGKSARKDKVVVEDEVGPTMCCPFTSAPQERVTCIRGGGSECCSPGGTSAFSNQERPERQYLYREVHGVG